MAQGIALFWKGWEYYKSFSLKASSELLIQYLMKLRKLLNVPEILQLPALGSF